MGSKQNDSALDAMRKAVDSDPTQLLSRKLYASTLSDLGHSEAAMDAWRDTLKLSPDDVQANSGMGFALIQQKRYKEALPYMELAAKNDPSSPVQNGLGSAYLQAGEIEKGADTLEKLADADPKPEILNDVAYELASNNAGLTKALEYAQRAVAGEEKESRQILLDSLLPEELANPQKLAMFWDTLGWVNFQFGNLDQAEDYLQSAWLLSQNALLGEHLGQVYERQKKTEKAIRTYRLALAAPAYGYSMDLTRERLEHLTGAKYPTKLDPLHPNMNGSELSQMRSVKLKQMFPKYETAEFFLFFSTGPKVEDVKFISGSQKLKSASDVLYDAKFQIALPKGSSAHLLRRAIVSCSGVAGCIAVLLIPDNVKSLN